MEQAGSSPIITLTTDFGYTDHYVGTMKGVILSRCANARVFDICHGIEAFSIYEAAYTIDQAAPYYPEGSIHVIVVDPGVGTARRGILVTALNRHFIAPDNGVLTMVVARDKRACARVLANPEFWLSEPSSTFHGRDIFAATAGTIASRPEQAEEVGPLVDDMTLLGQLEPQAVGENTWAGRVLSVDHFGNVITSFTWHQFGADLRGSFVLTGNRYEITEYRRTFGEAEPGLCFAYLGSSGRIEVGVNQGSAATHTGLRPGDLVHIRTKMPG